MLFKTEPNGLLLRFFVQQLSKCYRSCVAKYVHFSDME